MDRLEEIQNEFEEIFRAAWLENAFDWPGIVKHFADKYGPSKADAYFMGVMVGKQFAKDRVIGYAKYLSTVPLRELLSYVDSNI